MNRFNWTVVRDAHKLTSHNQNLYKSVPPQKSDFFAYTWKSSQKGPEKMYYLLPAISPKEVRVQVFYCSLTYLDLAIVRGEQFHVDFPIVPGNQIVGRVIQKGHEVSYLKINQLVGIGYFRNYCGNCFYCNEGEDHMCQNVLYTDHYTSYPKFGGLSSIIQINSSACFLLPKVKDPIVYLPFLTGGSSIYNILRNDYTRQDKKTRVKIAVVGLGGLGQIALGLAYAMDFQAIGFSNDEVKLQKARKQKYSVTDQYQDFEDEFSLVLLCTRKITKAYCDLAISILQPGGHLAILSTHQGLFDLNFQQFVNKRLLVSFNRGASRKAIQQLLDLVGKVDINVLIDEYKEDDIKVACSRLVQSPLQRIVIRMCQNEEMQEKEIMPILDIPQEDNQAIQLIKALSKQ